MRKAAALILPVLLLGMLAAQFTGCEKYVLPDLTISPDTLRFGPDAGSLPLQVNTNVITTLYPESHDYWVVPDPDWIEETTLVQIHVDANPDTTQRIAVIPVKSESIKRTLVVIQARADTVATVSFP